MAKTATTKSIPRAKSPEDVGVSSKAVMDFIADAKEHSMEFHSFMVIRHGKVRRAKLYYLRERQGKAAKIKEVKRV